MNSLASVPLNRRPRNFGRSGLHSRSFSIFRSSGTSQPALTVHVKSKGSPYSIAQRRVPEPIPVLGSRPAGDVSHKPGGRLSLLSAKPAVTPATLKRAATNFAAW